MKLLDGDNSCFWEALIHPIPVEVTCALGKDRFWVNYFSFSSGLVGRDSVNVVAKKPYIQVVRQGEKRHRKIYFSKGRVQIFSVFFWN